MGVWLTGLLAAAGIGCLIAVSPIGGSAGVLLTITLLFAAVRSQLLRGLFLNLLGLVLLGYMFLGKGFAYLGLPPLYIGELVMALGLLTLCVHADRLLPLLRFQQVWVLIAFILWGLARTLPYLGPFGLDAARDAVLWAYAFFALSVGALLEPSQVRRIVAAFGRIAPYLVGWSVLAPAAYRLALLPKLPGSPVPILVYKAGDMAVHLAGAAGLVILGFLFPLGQRSLGVKEWLFWALWVGGFGIAASGNRGGMLAVLVCALLLGIYRTRLRWLKPIMVGTLLVTLFVVSGFEMDWGHTRKISPQQVLANALSIFGEASREGLEGTQQWRMAWWGEIIDYTLKGPYFWTGKGFGINLANDDGYQVEKDGTLRSPHNSHLTVLARMGAPGALLWVLLQSGWALALLRAYRTARRRANARLAALCLWVLGLWAALMVNAAFDVSFEGPQIGIWFWSLYGFGLALTRWLRSPEAPERSGWEGKEDGPLLRECPLCSSGAGRRGRVHAL